MKKPLLIAALLMGTVFTAKAQTTLFSDGFESYEDFIIEGIGNWSQIDLDGAPTYGIQQPGTPPVEVNFANSGYTGTAIIFNPSQTSPSLVDTWAAHGGNKTLNFFAAVVSNPDDPTAIGPNNDWFITPAIQLGTSGNSVSFWARSLTAQYGLERIKIAVSTSGNTDPADFTVISAGAYVSVPVDYTQYTYNLDAYDGELVYIAINYVSNDSFALLVDDFAVTTTGTLGTDKALESKFSVSPNPANSIVTIANAENMLVNAVSVSDLNGRVVKSAAFDNVTEAQVNIADLANGVYMMTISSDKGSVTKKIVKN